MTVKKLLKEYKLPDTITQDPKFMAQIKKFGFMSARADDRWDKVFESGDFYSCFWGGGWQPQRGLLIADGTG